MEVCKNEHHHPFETLLEAFFKLTGCLWKYLMLNCEKLLELNCVMAIRIGDN